MQQVRNMLANKRIFATGIYVLFMVLTLVAALKIKSVILTLVFLVFQFLALVWCECSCACYLRVIFFWMCFYLESARFSNG